MFRTISLTLATSIFLSFASAAHATFVINWTNKGQFRQYDPFEIAVIDTAISRWESVITDMDGDATTADVFTLQIYEADFYNLAAVVSRQETNSLPSSARISTDRGSNFARFPDIDGFFVDLTPETNEEFTSVSPYYGATADTSSDAYARFDLLTTMTHEIGHALGFGSTYSKFAAATDESTLSLDYTIGTTKLFSNTDDGLAHLSCAAASLDLMCSAGTFDNPEVDNGLFDGGTADRRFISELDLDILAGVYGYTVDKTWLVEFDIAAPSPVPLPAHNV